MTLLIPFRVEFLNPWKTCSLCSWRRRFQSIPGAIWLGNQWRAQPHVQPLVYTWGGTPDKRQARRLKSGTWQVRYKGIMEPGWGRWFTYPSLGEPPGLVPLDKIVNND